jgi:hypothetical protein
MKLALVSEFLKWRATCIFSDLLLGVGFRNSNLGEISVLPNVLRRYYREW